MNIHKKLYYREIIIGYSFNVKIGFGNDIINLIVVRKYCNSYRYICLRNFKFQTFKILKKQ